jgi:hypothetical protein
LEQNTNEYIIDTSSTINNDTYIIIVGSIYNDVKLLMKCVICEIYLELLRGVALEELYAY